MKSPRRPSINIKTENGVATVKLPRDFDLRCAKMLRPLLDQPAEVCRVDCSRVETFNSAGIGLLALLNETWREVVVRSPPPTMEAFLGVTGMSGLIER